MARFLVLIHTQLFIEGHQYVETDLETSNLVRTA